MCQIERKNFIKEPFDTEKALNKSNSKETRNESLTNDEKRGKMDEKEQVSENQLL